MLSRLRSLHFVPYWLAILCAGTAHLALQSKAPAQCHSSSSSLAPGNGAAAVLQIPSSRSVAPSRQAASGGISGESNHRSWPAFDQSLVFVQLPPKNGSDRRQPANQAPLGIDYGEGGRIILREKDGTLRVLSSQFHSAADPDVSFDGQRILFAGKKNASDRWTIYEMRSDGSDIRQVAHVAGDCRQPGYQSQLNTLVAERPWYQITFVSDVAGELNEQGSARSTNLYSCKLDGSLVTRLTFNPSGNMDPSLSQDGRLIFSSWQRSRLDRGLLGRVGLFAINLDGTDLALFSADEGAPIKRMPCSTAGGLGIFIEPSQATWDGAGMLSSVSLRRNLHSYRAITRKGDGLFHSPSPLPDGTILVSRRPLDDSGTHGIYRLDPFTGRHILIFDDPAHHDIQAKLLAARPEPDGRSTSVFVPTGDVDDPAKASHTPSNPMGKLYCLNAYISDLDRSVWMPPGGIKRLRVLEGVPRRIGDSPDGLSGPRGFGEKVRQEICIPPLVPRRILGDIPLEDDGSFNIQVPADIPIELQLLDTDGMMLRSCGWIWVKNNEPRGCIGCHEDGELTPENVLVAALKRASIPLTLPPDKRRSVDFTRDVLPIIEKRCASCHGPDRPLRLDGGIETDLENGAAWFNRAYASLMAAHNPAGAASPFGRYVHAGRARTSPLIWHLFRRDTSRPWDLHEGNRAAQPTPMPPSGSEPLSDRERRVLIEWIDTGAPWKGASAWESLPTPVNPSDERKR